MNYAKLLHEKCTEARKHWHDLKEKADNSSHEESFNAYWEAAQAKKAYIDLLKEFTIYATGNTDLLQ